MELKVNDDTAVFLKEKIIETKKDLFVRVYIRGTS